MGQHDTQGRAGTSVHLEDEMQAGLQMKTGRSHLTRARYAVLQGKLEKARHQILLWSLLKEPACGQLHFGP